MKFIRERKEFAKAVNFGKYPVISLDVGDKSKQFTIGGEVVGFTDVEVKIPLKDGRLDRAIMSWFNDSKKITFGSNCICISNNFGYEDVVKSARYANAPVIDKDTEFVLILHSSQTQKAMAILLKTSNYKDTRYCQTNIEVDETIDLFKLIKSLN